MSLHARHIAEGLQGAEQQWARVVRTERRRWHDRAYRGRVWFDEEVRRRHRRFRQSIPAFLRDGSLGNLLTTPVIYSLAGIGFWGGIIFNDALLMDVAEPPEYNRVSALGYSVGYVGGGLLLVVNTAMVTNPEAFGLSGAAQAVRIAFPMVAVWWLLFTIPCLLWVREQKPARVLPARDALRADPAAVEAALAGDCWKCPAARGWDYGLAPPRSGRDAPAPRDSATRRPPCFD